MFESLERETAAEAVGNAALAAAAEAAIDAQAEGYWVDGGSEEGELEWREREEEMREETEEMEVAVARREPVLGAMPWGDPPREKKGEGEGEGEGAGEGQAAGV